MMKNPAFGLMSLLVLAAASFAGNSTASFGQDNQDRRTIRRVKRPVFTEKDWKEIYFENLFEEGLVGPRPESKEPSVAKTTRASVAENAAQSDWSQYITREAIEDEIKSIQSQLQSEITTPGRFKSRFGDVRQRFSMLSMLFGIVHEFNQDIRWKQNARAAQIAFAEAADKARTATESAFELASRRKDDLTELIRGGTVPFEAAPTTALEWPAVVDRRSIMIRLDEALQTALRPATANQGEFEKQLETLSQQTNIVSALAQVLVQDSMADADDDGYTAYSRALAAAAAEMLTAIESRDFELAAKSVNTIEQSCNDCHGEWR